MNKQLQQIVNDNLREYFNPMKKQHKGLPGHNIGNTPAHERKKFEIAMALDRDGSTFIIEGILKNGLRPDITVIDTIPPICYEVMHSEKTINEQKRALYPGRIIEVRI